MKTKYECSGCGWEFDHGFDLCRGCGSTIVYGATDIELVNAGKWFGAIPLMLGFVVAALLTNAAMTSNPEVPQHAFLRGRPLRALNESKLKASFSVTSTSAGVVSAAMKLNILPPKSWSL